VFLPETISHFNKPYAKLDEKAIKLICSIPKLFHNPTLVRKLTNKKIRWIIRQLDRGTPVKEIAAVMRVTPRRIYQIKKQYEETGEIPELRQSGRTPKQIDREIEQIILQSIHIPHNTIYKIMLKHDLVVENHKHEREEEEK